jgi:hypothetical protein
MATEKIKVAKTFVSHTVTDKWRTPPTVVEWLAQWLGRKFKLRRRRKLFMLRALNISAHLFRHMNRSLSRYS